jgi:hypothetical protein
MKTVLKSSKILGGFGQIFGFLLLKLPYLANWFLRFNMMQLDS